MDFLRILICFFRLAASDFYVDAWNDFGFWTYPFEPGIANFCVFEVTWNHGFFDAFLVTSNTSYGAERWTLRSRPPSLQWSSSVPGHRDPDGHRLGRPSEIRHPSHLTLVNRWALPGGHGGERRWHERCSGSAGPGLQA